MCARRSSTNYWYRLPTPVDTSSAALPGAELPAGKSFRLKIASVQDFCFPSAFPTWIALRSVLFVDGKTLSKINFAGFFFARLPSLPGGPAASGGRWRLGGAPGPRHGGAAARDGMRCPGKSQPRLRQFTVLQNVFGVKLWYWFSCEDLYSTSWEGLWARQIYF